MRITALLVIIIAMSMMPALVHGQPREPGWYQGPPYGHCPGPRWGGPYGVRRQVTTPDEARQVIDTFFSRRGQTVTIGKVEEYKGYFEVEVLDPSGAIMDKIIVHKRTGRIRSIY